MSILDKNDRFCLYFNGQAGSAWMKDAKESRAVLSGHPAMEVLVDVFF